MRISDLIETYDDRFKEKIFSVEEILYCESKCNPFVHFSGRFAAKESIKKALYSSGICEPIPFNKINILSDANGAPQVCKMKNINYSQLSVSISHEAQYATGMALLIK